MHRAQSWRASSTAVGDRPRRAARLHGSGVLGCVPSHSSSSAHASLCAPRAPASHDEFHEQKHPHGHVGGHLGAGARRTERRRSRAPRCTSSPATASAASTSDSCTRRCSRRSNRVRGAQPDSPCAAARRDQTARRCCTSPRQFPCSSSSATRAAGGAVARAARSRRAHRHVQHGAHGPASRAPAGATGWIRARHADPRRRAVGLLAVQHRSLRRGGADAAPAVRAARIRAVDAHPPGAQLGPLVFIGPTSGGSYAARAPCWGAHRRTGQEPPRTIQNAFDEEHLAAALQRSGAFLNLHEVHLRRYRSRASASPACSPPPRSS